jgi:hypothetical protein
MAQHRHQEFVRFLNVIERAVPAGKLIHAIADNDATHKHPKVRAWLERHPRWGVPLHSDLGILDQRGRGLLLNTVPAKAEARRVPLDRRPRADIRDHNRSSGPNPQTPSSTSSADCLNLPSEFVH